jgi:carboxyl-terminal processing protease
MPVIVRQEENSMIHPRLRAFLCVATVFVLPMLLGGLLLTVAAEPGTKEEDAQSLRLFNNVLVLVEANYASRIDPERAVYGAIDGMLRTLDPHSKFLEPKAFKSLREDQTGSYAGLGIQVQSLFGKVTIVSRPFPGSPAEKADLRVGDMITHVDGKSTLGLAVEDVVGKLRGVAGTQVRVTISRPGQEQPFELDIIRQNLKKYTINFSYMIRPNVGYIKIDSFAETTGKELQEALKKMDPTKLEGLILDLRGNPGGLLQEAIRVGEAFLDQEDLILKTGGQTKDSIQDFRAKARNRDPKYPLVVLVDQNSASASEIVSGAIQDHDRGLIVGETTFGKGLVQSVYTLRNVAGDSGLLLTTQKWYTPSGRLIQRDYSQISQFDYYTPRDNPIDEKTRQVFYSDNGRIVYGGGGIRPDYIVERPQPNPFQTSLLENFVFFSFADEFFKTSPSIGSSFQVSTAMLEDFKKHLKTRQIPFADKDIQDNLDFIKMRIRHEIFYKRLGNAEAQKVLDEGDVQLQRALELLPEAKKVMEPVKRQSVQR